MRQWIVIIGMVVCFLSVSGVGGWVGTASSKPVEKKNAKTQLVSIQRLQRTLMKDIQGRIDTGLIKVSLQVLFPKQPIEVTAGKLELRVETDRFSHLSGRRAFRVQLLVDSELRKTVSIVASITARAEVMTPIRWIKLHEVLQSKDLVKTTVNLRTFNQDVVMHAADIVGKQATRSLPPHQPLRISYVAEPPLVHKGDRVMIEVRRGGLFVQTFGVAKASGHFGELILVTNQTSGREVLASVRSSGIVEVKF
ncbi:MAG: flagellar basal body P-ring formation chaperone FlgA [Nitrospirales bacterium]